MLANDADAREYFKEPPLVTFTRTPNLRSLIFRAKIPRILKRGGLRPTKPPGFYKCNNRINCALCRHSQNTKSYHCPVSGASVTLSQHITCQNRGIYLITCRKDTGICARVRPTYVGIVEADGRNFTMRLGEHVGTAQKTCQQNTVTPVGCHFRQKGHDVGHHLQMLPIETGHTDSFLLRAREAYYIDKFKTEKFLDVSQIEHGMNKSIGQQ